MNLTTVIGLFVLLMIGAFVGGCYRGEHNSETERLVLEASRDNAIASANACGETLGRINDETTRGTLEAEKRAARGQQAVVDAEKAEAQAQAQAARATGALQAAKRHPTCLAQLEVALCESIPLL